MEPDDLVGGRYRLLKRLDVGGMSVVWRGYDEVLGRQVAVKLLASRLATDRTFRRRIRVEARAAARLCHPYIATIHDYGESVGPRGATLPYVVMELIDGQSLASRLAGGQALPWRLAVTVGAQVAAALAAAHAHGVVHRDVTPGNVMLAESGAKVVDFGISAAIGERDRDIHGRILGTPAYLAPERIDGEPVAPATDVYALGLLLYRALTGRLPWPADTTTEMLRAHRYAEPPPLPPVDGLPANLAALCVRCLAKDPAERPSSAQVARELAAAIGVVPGLASHLARGEHEPKAPALAGPVATAAFPTTAHGPVSVSDRPRGGRRSAARRRVETVLVTVGLVLVSGLAWSGAASAPVGDESSRGWTYALGAGLGAPHRACTSEYRLQHDSRGAFTASIVVKNTGSEPFEGWELTFDQPGDQWVTGGTGGTWSQDGRTVTARAGEGAILAPGGTGTLTYSGGYRGINPIPGTFAVNGTACTALLLATPVPGARGGSGPDRGHDHDDDGREGRKAEGSGKHRGKGKGGGRDD